MTTALSREAVLTRITDLFFPRVDTHARSWLKADHSMGFSPACACSPDCKKGSGCPNWQPVPVTDEVIYRHLKAASLHPRPATIGSYGVSPSDEARWTVFDVDAHGTTEADRRMKQADALVTLKLLRTQFDEVGLPYYVEHSGSGYHAWVFAHTTAQTAHRAGHALLQQAEAAYGTLPAPVEVYPKQEGRSGGGFANLLKLPWGLHYSGRRTRFIDPQTFEPLADQWGQGGLLGFAQADLGTLEKLAQGYRPEQRRTEQPQETSLSELLKTRLHNGEGRNDALFQLACGLRRSGLFDMEAALLILEPWNQRHHEPLPHRELLSTVRSAYHPPAKYGAESHSKRPFLSNDSEDQDREKSSPAASQAHFEATEYAMSFAEADIDRYLRQAAYERKPRWN